MKSTAKWIKLLCVVTVICLLPLSSLTSCGGDEPIVGQDNTSALTVDLDYSKFSDTMLYDTMVKFSADSEHRGKTVKMRAEYGGVFDFSQNTYKNVIEQYDATACCAAYYELKLSEGVDRPLIGSTVEIVGSFEDGYILVTALTLVKGDFDTSKIDIDAANMSRDELTSFLGKIKLPNNEYKDKTVRICGHYAKSADGFHYLVGYESSALSDKLSSTWSFELHSDTVEFPEITDNYIYAYEVIGTVSTYKADDGTWPCIEIISFRPITTYTV